MNLGLGQGDPVEVNAAKNLAQQKRSDNATAGRQPAVEQDRVRFGKIVAVNSNNLVKVRLMNNQGDLEGPEIVNGSYLPLMNPLSAIYLMWGSLRPGLICRVYWHGKLDPDASSVVEIIADEEHNFLKKEPESNEIATQPYKLLSGGMGG